MYNHTAIKQNGYSFYSANKKATILTTLIYILLSKGISGILSRKATALSLQIEKSTSASEILSATGSIYLLSGILIIISIFVFNILKASFAGYFNKSIQGLNPTTNEIFSGFKHYSTFLSATFLRDIYTFLWSLLFIIPGIVKQYAYSMVDYIICENSSVSADKAIGMSNTMTKGYKSNLFYLDLSFVGWIILGGLTFNILNICFVIPYYESAKAYAYEQLKSIAISEGKLSPSDFGQYSNNTFGNIPTDNNVGGNPYNIF